MRRHFAFVLILLASIAPLRGDASAQSTVIKRAMQEKLLSAQRLLESVVKGDHAATGRHVAPLARISEAEIASWQMSAHRQYANEGSAFLIAVQDLREAAERRDIEGITTAYGNLVSSCIRCHVYVRGSRTASNYTWRRP